MAAEDEPLIPIFDCRLEAGPAGDFAGGGLPALDQAAGGPLALPVPFDIHVNWRNNVPSKPE